MAKSDKRNVLWIMCDQLRHDYFGCAGHPHIDTPNIDWLADDGVRFTSAFAQSTICGASRVSAYTGRYVRSHGATGNEVALRVGEPTLGDHLKSIGADNVLVGKTHMRPDEQGMARLGIDAQSEYGAFTGEAGFIPFARHDGLHPQGEYDPDPDYNDYLRSHGMDGENLWEEYANSTVADDGSVVSGWLMENANRPARVPKEQSETAYVTDRAIEFLKSRNGNDRSWNLHLSYIKPHWPYLAPAPYHALYGREHIVPAVRCDEERVDPHPLYDAFLKEKYSTVFCRDDVRDRVVPAYMGMIKEVDDHLGRLFDFLRAEGQIDNTLIIFTADHGDYLGDHWLGEKYLFHDASVRIPMIIRDPRTAADATRAQPSDDLVEMIDLAPTILDFIAGVEVSKKLKHVLQGQSLLPLLCGQRPADWRTTVFSEYDFAYDAARVRLGTPVDDSCATMLFDGRWKFVHVPDNPPILFDLQNDPDEFNDLGRSKEHTVIIQEMLSIMFDWCRKQSNRITISDQDLTDSDPVALAYDRVIDHNIYIGYWDETELENEKRKKTGAMRSIALKSN